MASVHSDEEILSEFSIARVACISGISRIFSFVRGGSGGHGFSSKGIQSEQLQVSYYELYTMQVFGSDAYSHISRKSAQHAKKSVV